MSEENENGARGAENISVDEMLPSYLTSDKLTLEDFKKHLSGPLLSLVVHIVILLIAGTVIITEPPKPEADEIVVEMKNIEAVPPPPPPPPDIPVELNDLEAPTDIPLDRPVVNTPTMTITNNITADVSTGSSVADVNMQSVNLTAPVSNSALKLTGLYAARSAGNRMVAVKQYGGSNATEAAVQKALKWLASVQNEDGTWGDTAPQYSYWTVQLTCLALLAYLAHGDSPQTPEYGENILRGLKKVTEWAEKSWTNDPERFIRNDINAHARMCIVLAEGYAITHIPMLEHAMNKAVAALLKDWTPERPWGMNPIGGYYSTWNPRKKEMGHYSDLDRESRAYNALYSAYAAGCEVPGLKEKIERAIKNMGTTHKAADGGFNYKMVKGAKGSKGSFEGTAAGTLYMYLMGGESPAAREGLAWLERYRPGDKDNSELKMDWKNLPGEMSILGWYYMTQALFQGYSGKGNKWQRWNKSMVNALIHEQDPRGFWPCPSDKYPVYKMLPQKNDMGEIVRDKNGQPRMEKTECVMPESSYGGFSELNGRIWATVYFCMSLEVYYRYLPTFKIKDKPVKPGEETSSIDAGEDDSDLSL